MDGARKYYYTVHPRWRGEQDRRVKSNAPFFGSSPLARGTVEALVNKVAETRFIPAGAGNRLNWRGSRSNWPVHPRWRGEQKEKGVYPMVKDGSSPLARGTVDNQYGYNHYRRFIPAGAGNRPFDKRSSQSGTVHPRWRGEQFSNFIDVFFVNGSSPLARGTAIQRRP